MLKSVLAITVPLALLGAPLSGLDAEDEDSARSDAYDAMLGCAAFHTIESTSSSGDAAAAQKAVAYDFAGVAARLAPDGRTETANADLEKRLTDYRAKLDTGDVREMAEEWTALDSACRELYPVRDAVVKALAAEPAADPER